MAWSRVRLEPGKEAIVTDVVWGRDAGIRSRKGAVKEECGYFGEGLLARIPTFHDGQEAVENDSFCHTHHKPVHMHNKVITSGLKRESVHLQE